MAIEHLATPASAPLAARELGLKPIAMRMIITDAHIELKLGGAHVGARSGGTVAGDGLENERAPALEEALA
jgi:hypothetical protein